MSADERTAPELVRELTYNERATWGDCPVCHAAHGSWCNPLMGIALGSTADGRLPENGVHLGRLQHAPKRVKVVPCG